MRDDDDDEDTDTDNYVVDLTIVAVGQREERVVHSLLMRLVRWLPRSPVEHTVTFYIKHLELGTAGSFEIRG